VGGCGGAATRSAMAVAPAVSAEGVPPAAEPDPGANQVPGGFTVTIAVRGLTSPSSVEFDGNGALYVAEAGASPGGGRPTAARVLRIARDGSVSVVADRLAAPVTDLLWHEDRLYISHRGMVSVLVEGEVRVVVDGLPSGGDHPNHQLAAGPDGYLYLGQGTVTNAGVVGGDNATRGWLGERPTLHDVPARDVAVTDQAFAAAIRGSESVRTGAFQPLGQHGARTIPGAAKANGAILRFRPDGSGLEAYAWGLRAPIGVQWSADGHLYASDDGMEPRGSRPIANAPDVLWDIRRGAWYGWPDFAGGEPVTEPRFVPAEGPAPTFVLAEHPPVEQPLLRLEPGCGVAKLAVVPEDLGADGTVLVARFGDLAPTVDGDERRVGGRDVVIVDPRRGRSRLFMRARREPVGPTRFGHSTGAGLKRPVDVVWAAGERAVYVVDAGALPVAGNPPAPRPQPGTGVVWRVAPAGSRPVLPPDIRIGSEAEPAAPRLEEAAPNGPAGAGDPLPPSRRPLDDSDRPPLQPIPPRPVDTARPPGR
jgi:glucose/arabinose dehydrogenase